MHAIPAFMIIHAGISDLYHGKCIVENGPHNGNKLIIQLQAPYILGQIDHDCEPLYYSWVLHTHAKIAAIRSISSFQYIQASPGWIMNTTS